MDALEYAKQLVSFPSVSRVSNQPVSDCVEQLLKDIGFEIERQEYHDKNGELKVNVLGRKGSGAGGFAYFGHTDVVPADEWFTEEHGPFEPTVVGDRLYGRGSCDMKGSVACALAAAAQFDAADLKSPIYITCTADEEVGYWGADLVARESQMFREMVNGNARGIIGEPTELEVVYAHKGTYGFKAVSNGEAAHSSTAHGENANLAMIPFLMDMKQIHDEVMNDPAWMHDEFDPPSLGWNIGINDHTGAVNIKAAQSICTVYFRPMPGQDPETLLDRVKNSAERHGVQLEIGLRGAPLYVDPNSAYVQEMLRLTDHQKPKTVSYGTDGAKLGDLQQLVVIGPGSIRQAHTKDEWIDLGQLTRGTELYSQLIKAWCC